MTVATVIYPGLQSCLSGWIDRDGVGPEGIPGAPVKSPDGRYWLWAAGEVFAGLPGTPGDLKEVALRCELLARMATGRIDALADVDGEFQVAVWDAEARTLTLACDRFGCRPLYWASAAGGFAFGSSVAGVLARRGVSLDPDPDAIREAVTFGGFRLGDRTNLRAVRMLRGARTLTWDGRRADVRVYWRWPAEAQPDGRSLDGLVEEAHALWRDAIRRRLHGTARPGNTLSGGLDSRAILAEATAQGTPWTCVTYGWAPCDDETIARAAAERAGATWHFMPLYADGWLDRRTVHIAHTDGLVQLADLMHMESLDLQAAVMDVQLSGYTGDAVCGPTFSQVRDARDVVQKMPYSGVPLAWDEYRAVKWAEAAIADIAPGAPRFVLFEHKLPQSIHRIFQAADGRLCLRRPFLDHALFDFFAGVDGSTRARVYHTMLVRHYPHLFARLPHQRTGARLLAPAAEVQVRRALRYVWRRAHNVIAATGLVQRAPSRAYHDEERHWRAPAVAARISDTILRRGSISAEIFGRAPLASFITDWLEGGPGPAQVVGALFVFEHYHRDLAVAPPGMSSAVETS